MKTVKQKETIYPLVCGIGMQQNTQFLALSRERATIKDGITVRP